MTLILGKTKTPSSKTPPTTLLDALSEENAAERRKQLRALAMPALKAYPIEALRQALMESPIVGAGPNQVNPKGTHSGICMLLDEDTLIELVLYETAGNVLVEAIRDPNKFGTPSMTSKTSYVFGRHRVVRNNLRETLLAGHVEGEPMIPMSEFGGLSDRLNVYDYIASQGWDMEDVLHAMGTVIGMDQTTADAMRSLLLARSEEPSPINIDALPTEVVDAITKVEARLAGEDDLEDDQPATDVATAVKYELPDDAAKRGLVDLALGTVGMPDLATLIGELNTATEKAAAVTIAPVMELPASESGDIPSGKIVTARAYDVFGIKGVAAKSFDFDVPAWEWDAPHPHVPAIDADYRFQGHVLQRVLYALLTNKRAYLQGHTGTGKTTHLEQIAARLNWPCMRVNFDSEITRMDLIGRDTLVQEGGTTVSRFVDGILPQILEGPYIGIFDEIDFVRPDVGYVMQRALEGNGLVVTEDGGRVIKAHPMSRLFATGNTVGQGDEYGMYQGARPQSMALLERFTVWIKGNYLSERERKQLIQAHAPSVPTDMVELVSKYVTEHIEAFTTSKVMQPITPRGYLELAAGIATFTRMMPDSKKAVDQAVEMVMLDRASVQDRAVLLGIANRVFV